MKWLVGAALFSQVAFGLNVALDIGHSEKRGGAYSATGKSEYTYNLRFAKELGKAFEDAGIDYKFINHVKLRDRVKEVNQGDFDLFISIHHDSVKEKYLSYRGKQHYSNVFEGYSLFASSKNKFYKKSIKIGNNIGYNLINSGFKYTAHHNEPIKGENRPFINKEVGLYNFKDLIVLKGVKIPALLIEVGIIVNEYEEKMLNQKWYRKKFIENIVKGVKSE